MSKSSQIRQLNKKVDNLLNQQQTTVFKPVPFYICEKGKYYLMKHGERIEVAEPKGIDQPQGLGFSSIIMYYPNTKETEDSQ